jgi:hypothetical protein
MNSDSKTVTIRRPDSINLSLATKTFASIDAASAARPRNVSRNTRIVEAVQEKLARERRSHG